jgi:MFS family permease
MTSALNLALPYINADFSLSTSELGWITTSYMLTTAIFQIPAARIADIIGRRTVFVAGLVVFVVCSLMSGFAPSGGTLIAMRALTGVGSAMMFSTNIAIMTAAVPTNKRGWALGMHTASVYFSLAAGPFVGGLLTQTLGWHSIFFLSTGISFMVLLGAVFSIKDNWRSDGSRKFDYAGAIVYAGGLFALIYGFSELPSLHGFIILAVGIITLIFFTLHERRHSRPLFNVNIFFTNRLFKHASLSALINYAATASIAFMLSLYLQYTRGLSPIGAGAILIGQSLVMAFVSMWSGSLSDRISAPKMASTGMAIVAAGLIGFCFLSETTPFVYIIGILVVIGFGFGIFSSPNMNVIMSSVKPEEYGLASASTGTVRLVGQAFSMGLAMMAISITIGDTSSFADNGHSLMSSMRTTFIISAILCSIGVYSSSRRKK